jgi:FkbM family methyltransferase
MFVVFLAGEYLSFHDVYGIPFLLAAAGAIILGRNWKAWVVAAAFVGVALYWSSAEQKGCSFWWRSRYVVDKALGRLPYVSWDDVRYASFNKGHCFYPEEEHRWIVDSIKLLDTEIIDGHKYQQFKTDLGNFWIAESGVEGKATSEGEEPKEEGAAGQSALAWLLFEVNVYEAYQGHEDTVLPGDTVVDAGAHVGVYTRYALKQGAARVISIEPDPTNIVAFERNFADEIASGKVILIKAGVWNEESDLQLQIHDHISTRATLFSMEGIDHSITVPVRPLDDMVDDLQLDRVDFIKMDIEGAERQALEGARRTIQRFHPRMAICTYHMVDDPVVVPEVALNIQPDYRVHAKELEVNHIDTRPKILFFN